MNQKIISILIAVLIISGISFFVVKDLLIALSPSDSYSAVIVKCATKESRTNNKKGGRMTVTSYAPVAVSQEGYQATGMMWTSSKSSCERMIGRETSILVNRDNPEKTRIKSFFQIWGMLGGVLMIVSVLAFIGRKTILAIGFLVAFIIFMLTAGAYEFGVFQKRIAQSDWPAVASDES